MKNSLILCFLLAYSFVFGQVQTKRVLFLGNSYTAANNLPQMIADVALSAGDTLYFDSNTPGGYTLEGHSTNETSLNKIKSGDWDFVVLQEQSQRPSLPIEQVMVDVFPYAKALDSIINAFNSCCETVFYMTWGRKNGDASNCDIWPPVCTYEGMDSLLNLRYRMMADSNAALLSPVGAVWHRIRDQYPGIELYSADESHPSVAGTYAAACCFYSSLFRKDPLLITYNPALTPLEAAQIRAAASIVVFDSLLNWHIGEYDPKAAFTFEENGNLQVTFFNTSLNASEYLWDFGDGENSLAENPVHTFEIPGVYGVKLHVSHCQFQDSIVQTVDLSLTGINGNLIDPFACWYIIPVPALTNLTLENLPPIDVHYRILNSNGQEMKHGILEKSAHQISIAFLPKGLYILQLLWEDKLQGMQKFVKE